MSTMGKKRFLSKKDVYTQRRSIGAFVAVIVKSNGEYRTSCDLVETEARNELVCKNESDSDASSQKSADTREDKSPVYAPEVPEITKGNKLELFIQRAVQEHDVKPDLIIVYRDGVGDSMLDAVYQTEVEQAKKGCKTSKLIYTVAQKRIHTRFMITKNVAEGEIGNPPPGTIVQEYATIGETKTKTNYSDFFLIPTKSSLSTVKPVRFIILYDDKILPMEQFQSLTYAMCFCYPNWTDSIKLPFPTQLAHKLASLMGESQISKAEIHKELFKTYFYL